MNSPSSKLASLQATEKKHLLNTYARNPVVFTGGSGVRIHDDEGHEYLDLLSGIGVLALGYNHPAVNAAIVAQSTKLIHTSNLFFHEGTAPVIERLARISGLDRVFLCNSGTEAWEAALKLARAHAKMLREQQGKNIGSKFLALSHSFHGRTMGSVATTYKAQYREPFAPVMPCVDFVEFNDVDDLRAKFSNAICAICIEPIQGEGGIHPVSKEFFEEARALCDSTGALLLADEIQCGMGRTGKWFAYQHYDLLPDVVTLAKPIANGIPMGAMLCKESAAAAISPGMHGTTFGGGPLACAAALAVIDTIERDQVLSNVVEVGEYFKQQLNELATRHSAIVDVRGIGLMLGIELNSTELATQITAEMMARRIILNRTSDTVLRFLPPYILERAHVDEAVHALDELFTNHAKQAGAAALAGEHANG